MVDEPTTSTRDSTQDEETENRLNIVLAINRAYQEVIDEKLNKLKSMLAENLRKQSEIIDKMSNQAVESVGEQKSQNQSTSIRYEKEFGRIKENYFKDLYQVIKYLKEPEDNQDTIRKSKLVYCDKIPVLKSEWTIHRRNKLKQAVLDDSIRLIKLPFKNKIALIEEKIYLLRKKGAEPQEINRLVKTLKEANNQLKKTDNLKEEQILNEISADKVDWMKISKVDLNDQWSEMECRLVWINVCHPKVNQNKWTSNENQRLIELARVYRERNWEKIAAELNTNRSAFLCMKRYHEKTAYRYCKRDWSNEEARELIEMAEKHRIGHFVPYNYLCYLNGTRDRNSIMSLYLKADPNLNHGKWTSEEELALDEALRFYTTRNWPEIAEYVGTRTAVQCRDRYELKYMYPDKYVNWSREEDKLLLDSVDQIGAQWSRIAATHFPTRTDHSCLFRYSKLMLWRRKNEWLEAQPDDIREFVLFVFRPRTQQSDDCETDAATETAAALYTSRGEVVPVEPKFGLAAHNFQAVVEKIYESRELVAEFVEKKRAGKLSLPLLTRIGIFSPVLNSLIAKYKKINATANIPTPVRKTTSKARRGKSTVTSPKKPNTEQNGAKKRGRKPKARRSSSKQSKENDEKADEPKSTTPTQRQRTAVEEETDSAAARAAAALVELEKRRDRKKRICNIINDPSAVKTRKPRAKTKKLNENEETITLNSTVVETTTQEVQISVPLSLPEQQTQPVAIVITPQPVQPQQSMTKLSRLKISEMKNISNFDLKKSDKTRTTIRQLLEKRSETATIPTPSEPTTSQVTEPTQNGTKRKRKSNSISPRQTKTPAVKRKSRKDSPSDKVTSENAKKKRTGSKSAENEANRQALQTQIQSIIEGLREDSTQSFVDFDHVEDGTKIPILMEQQKEYRYMYSLKKESATRDLFKKFKIIKCKDTMVGIKPLNWPVSSGYLNESRLSAIERGLNKIK